MTKDQEALLLTTARALRQFVYCKSLAGDTMSEEVVADLDAALEPFGDAPAAEAHAVSYEER